MRKEAVANMEELATRSEELKVKSKKYKVRKYEGITLISLVITIILLIILAGVAINLSIGENGLFNKAKFAKETMDEATVKENIDRIVIEIQMEEIQKGNKLSLQKLYEILVEEYSNISLEKYNEGDTELSGTYNLNGIEYSFSINSKFEVTVLGKSEPAAFKIEVSDIKSKSIVVTLKTQPSEETNIKDYTYVAETTNNKIEKANITETSQKITGLTAETTYTVYVIAYDDVGNASVSNKIKMKTAEQESIAQIIASNPNSYYGKKVTNYTAGDMTWRVFYVDVGNEEHPNGYFGDGAGTIYLKVDLATNYNYMKYSTSYNPATTKVKTMNPLWAAHRQDASWNQGEMAAAWLCDPEKWQNYCDSTKALYAMGAPSVEMYIKSYNETHPKNESGELALDCYYQEQSSYGYGYKAYGVIYSIGTESPKNSIDFNDRNYNYIYSGPNGNLWLASPSSGGYSCVAYVENVNSKRIGLNNANNSEKVQPIVALRPDFIPEIEGMDN